MRSEEGHLDKFNRRRILFYPLIVLTSSRLSLAATQTAQGKFRGKIVAEWMSDGRKMKLLQSLEYVSSEGVPWPVPMGTMVDGASIPSVFWSVIGGPFEGLYRGPSVIHDFYCSTRLRTSTDVHKVFYDAMLTTGVGPKQAWLMYQAVLRFGPQWDNPKIDPKCRVVDERYDFEKCASNAAKPVVRIPSADKNELLRFTELMEDEADASDIAKLRNAIK
jgi:hypothetical protein